VIATARKLAVLLHRLWVSGEAYEPLRNSRPVVLPAAPHSLDLRIGSTAPSAEFR
jgi:hypothetical protein